MEPVQVPGYTISIHALLAESDLTIMLYDTSALIFLSTLSLRRATFDTLSALAPEEFLSTLSLRRATWLRCWQLAARDISIHALLAESDCRYPARCVVLLYFYPRSPCGERRWLRCWQLAARDISIHALLAESD